MIAAIQRGKQKAFEQIAERERREREQLAHNIYTAMINANLEEETMVLIAAKRRFNLGEKRMRELIAEVKAVKREYEDYRRDDVFAYMAKKEFSDININIPEEIQTNDDIRSALATFETARKPSATDDEAESIAEQMKAIRKMLAG